eukprot:gene36492-9050_t
MLTASPHHAALARLGSRDGVLEWHDQPRWLRRMLLFTNIGGRGEPVDVMGLVRFPHVVILVASVLYDGTAFCALHLEQG